MKRNLFSILKCILLLYLILTVLVPIVMLFSQIRIEHIKAVITSVQFLQMLKNSMVTTLVATVISTIIAFMLAYVIHRTNVKFKSAWIFLFTIPMLIPSISHGMGLVLLFGDNGILTNFLGIQINLYGYCGLIMGSVLYSYPVAFLMFCDALQYEDFTTYEAAEVLGISKWKQFLKITIPSMKRALISAVLAVFTMIFTDYGVPLMTGGTIMTLPVYMYREVIGMMNFSNGAVVGVILLMPAVIAFLMDLLKNNADYDAGTVTKSYQIAKNKIRDIGGYIVLLVSFIMISLPILAFVNLGFVKQYPIDMSFSFDNVKKLISNGVGMFFVNSVAVALLTSLLGTCLAYYSAYATTRSNRKLSHKVLHFLSMLPLAIPGVVLGLSYVMTFKNIPLYGTIFMLVIVNVIHFFASPYLMAYNSLSKFNPNLEDVAHTLGIGRIRVLLDVYIPSTRNTVVEMYSYFFVNSMITISAVSFLINFRTMQLSLMIPQLESQSFIEGTALVSLIILGVNMIEKGIAFLVKRT